MSENPLTPVTLVLLVVGIVVGAIIGYASEARQVITSLAQSEPVFRKELSFSSNDLIAHGYSSFS